MNTCKTCELGARRDAGEAPLWDNILRTPYWDLVHSYNTALPGWLVLVARRHIEADDRDRGQDSRQPLGGAFSTLDHA